MLSFQPEISVVISVYKNIEFLETTLKSVLCQLNANFEIILINDGNSNTDTQIIHTLSRLDSRIRVIDNDKNLGLTRSLIRGCVESKGKYIARIDNGDIMFPNNRLEAQRNTLSSHDDIVLSTGRMFLLEVDSKKLYISQTRTSLPYTARTSSGEALLNDIPHVTVMFKKETYFNCGGYNPHMIVGQDTELWPRLLQQGNVHYETQPLVIALMWPNSISINQNRKQIHSKMKRLVREIEWFSLSSVSSQTIAISLEAIKLLIPNRIRASMKHKRKYRLIGKLRIDSFCSFHKIIHAVRSAYK